MEGSQPRHVEETCLTPFQATDKLRVLSTEFAARRSRRSSPGAVGKANAQENVSAESAPPRQSARIPRPHEESRWTESPGEAAGKGSACPHGQLRAINPPSQSRAVRNVSPNPGASAAEPSSSVSTARAPDGRARFFPPFPDEHKQGIPARQDSPSAAQ